MPSLIDAALPAAAADPSRNAARDDIVPLLKAAKGSAPARVPAALRATPLRPPVLQSRRAPAQMSFEFHRRMG